MTTPYTLQIAPRAANHIRALPPKLKKFVFRLAEALSINPRPPGAKKVSGMTGLYSETIDHMRLVYKVEDQEIILLLVITF